MKQRGFTLIEMLVVLVIIGILSTAVALSINPGPRRLLDAEAARLASLLESANAEALAGQRRLAWTVHDHDGGYDFLLADDALTTTPRWLPVGMDDHFRSRRLDDEVRISHVEVDGRALAAGELLIFRRGDPPLFRIILSAGKGQAAATSTVLGLPSGRVTVTDGK